jgi:hypothetical protein
MWLKKHWILAVVIVVVVYWLYTNYAASGTLTSTNAQPQ